MLNITEIEELASYSYNEDYKKMLEIIEKVKNERPLSEEEVEMLVGECSLRNMDPEWKEITISTTRWSRIVVGCFSIGTQWYQLKYERGLTEIQDDYFPEQTARKIDVREGYVKATSYGGYIVSHYEDFKEEEPQ